MSVIVLLIIFSVIIAFIFLITFIWAVKSGQYDDTDSPSVRILFDNEKNQPPTDENNKKKK